MIYLNYVPTFIDKVTAKQESFNEFFFLIICYHFVLFGGIIWGETLRKPVEVSLVFFLFLFLALNFFFIGFMSVRRMLSSRRLKKIATKRKKIIEERNSAIEILKDSQKVSCQVNLMHYDTVTMFENRAVYDQEIKNVIVRSSRELKYLV